MEQSANSSSKEQPLDLDAAIAESASIEPSSDPSSSRMAIEEEEAFSAGADLLNEDVHRSHNTKATVTSEDLDNLYERIAALGRSDTNSTPNQNSREAALNEQQAFKEQSPELDHATQARIAESQARCDAYASETWLKEWLAPKVFDFMQMWCRYVAIVFLVYFAIKDGDVPSEVMIALLTTTTVSIVGLVGFRLAP